MSINNVINYWFIIEPYVYIRITTKAVLLYNTLDGSYVLSSREEIIELVKKILDKKNVGVVLLEADELNKEVILRFIEEVRSKFIGDIINTRLSSQKPIQVIPTLNSLDDNKFEVYKRQNFPLLTNLFENLHKIELNIDEQTNITQLIEFLLPLNEGVTLNICFNIPGSNVLNKNELMNFLEKYNGKKIITSSYRFPFIDYEIFTDFKMKIDLPLDLESFLKAQTLIKKNNIEPEYIFEVKSEKDCEDAEYIIEQYHLEKYNIKPIYTGQNLSFFQKNVFLSEVDILSQPLSLKDVYLRQMINIFYFGRLCVMSDGKVYSNIHGPIIGNVTDNIKDILQREVQEGHSWFYVRRHSPCNDCVFQWLCPSPSEYESQIGIPNLCHVC